MVGRGRSTVADGVLATIMMIVYLRFWVTCIGSRPLRYK